MKGPTKPDSGVETVRGLGLGDTVRLMGNGSVVVKSDWRKRQIDYQQEHETT